MHPGEVASARAQSASTLRFMMEVGVDEVMASISPSLRRGRGRQAAKLVCFTRQWGENVRTISYMPGSNFAIVSASSRKGSGAGSRRMAS